MATISLLHFDESQDAVLNNPQQPTAYPIDSAGAVAWHTGGPNSGLSIEPGGKFGGCLRREGGEDAEAFLVSSFLSGLTEATLESWIYLPDITSTALLLSFENEDEQVVSGIQADPSTGKVQWVSLDTSTQELVVTPTSASAPTNGWAAYAIVYDSESNVHIYLNGQRIHSQPADALPTETRVALRPSDGMAYDEIRLSRAALYTGETYDLQEVPFSPAYEQDDGLVQTQTTLMEEEPPSAPKLTQIKAQSVSYDLGTLSPSFYLTQVQATKTTADRETFSAPTYLTQVRATSTSADSVPAPYYTYVSQLQAVSPTSETVDLPTFYTYVSQLQAVSPTADSVPLPIFATHLTQLRNIALIGKLTSKPDSRVFLSQYRVQGIDVQPLSTEPITFTLDKQVIQSTEPAEFVRLYTVQNLVAKQEFFASEVTFYGMEQQTALSEEAPSRPPQYLYQNMPLVSLGEYYDLPWVMQSPTMSTATMQGVSLKDTYTDPSLLQSGTLQTNLTETISSPEVLRDPETLQASTIAPSISSILSLQQLYADPEDMYGATAQHSALINYSAQEGYGNPLDFRSFTVQYSDLILHSETDSYADPDTLFSTVQENSLVSSLSLPAIYSNPDALLSTIQALQIATLLSYGEDLEDPDVIQSVTKSNTLSSYVSTEAEYLDPDDIVITSLNFGTVFLTSASAIADDPLNYRSSSRHMLAIATLSAPDTNYLDPDMLYEYPARQRSLIAMVSVPEVYASPFGYGTPVVNVNYYWA